MTTLSDIQLILLTTASQRADGNLLPPPESISNAGARLQKALAGVAQQALAAEAEVAGRAPSWREDGDVRFGLTITDAGRAAIGVPTLADAGDANEQLDKPESGGVARAATGPTPPLASPISRTASKQAMIIDLLQRDNGASITDLTDATHWLPHTTRAALTSLRKRGLQIDKEKVGGVTRYRISAELSA